MVSRHRRRKAPDDTSARQGGACAVQSGASGPGRRVVRSLRRDGGPSAQQPARAAAASLGQGRPRLARRTQAEARVSGVGVGPAGGPGVELTLAK